MLVLPFALEFMRNRSRAGLRCWKAWCKADLERRQKRASFWTVYLQFPRKQKSNVRYDPWSVTGNTYACDAFRLACRLIDPIFDRHRIFSQDGFMKSSNSSMQLTRAADYAVRVMIHLNASPDRRLALPTLARATGAPASFLSKVLQALTRAALIASRRGQAGGFHITARGRKATMREVIEAIDGAICLNRCLAPGRSCPRKAHCPAHPVWVEAQRAMFDVLSGVTVAAMAAQTPLRRPKRTLSRA